MTQESRFEPEPFLVVSDLGQLKAFTDPLRNRVLHILQSQEATARQIAATLNVPLGTIEQHLIHLLRVKLIRRTGIAHLEGADQRLYRATARIFEFRPDPNDRLIVSMPVTRASLESVAHEFAASLEIWPDQRLYGEVRRGRIPPERREEFYARLRALIDEYWSAPENGDVSAPDEDVMAFGAVMYRFPGTD